MEESISQMVDGLLLDTAISAPAHAHSHDQGFGVDTHTPTPPAESTPFVTPPSSADSSRSDNLEASTAENCSSFNQNNIDFHVESPNKSSQELLNHLNTVLASIPANAPPTPVSPNDLRYLPPNRSLRPLPCDAAALSPPEA